MQARSRFTFWLALGAALADPGAAWAAGMSVVDAHGNTVGQYLGYGGGRASVLYDAGRGQVILELAQIAGTPGLEFASPVGAFEPTLFFESTNCTGTPYILVYDAGAYPALLFKPSWGGSKSLLYVADSAESVSLVPHSQVQTRSHECLSGQGRTRLWRVSAPPIDLDSMFTRPFVLQPYP